MAPALRALATLIVMTVVVTLSTACGPISAHSVIKVAEAAVKSAETAGAKDGAPYEYHSAVAYLSKAREEEGYSDYQAAVDLSNLAIKFAETARAKAVAGGDPDQRIDPERAKAKVKANSKGGQK
tara:strand:- start:12 stop:386 length:375 start_codon:yes stop_codon:yes gene_type:complete